jgi:hypothetical protein
MEVAGLNYIIFHIMYQFLCRGLFFKWLWVNKNVGYIGRIQTKIKLTQQMYIYGSWIPIRFSGFGEEIWYADGQRDTTFPLYVHFVLYV